MTLNRVVVDLAKTFEQGQAYVACKIHRFNIITFLILTLFSVSRARSLDGLKVESFPQRAQSSGNVQVKEFLREKFGIE
jgi:ATP-dependent DNA helicase PIF1